MPNNLNVEAARRSQLCAMEPDIKEMGNNVNQ
jgi:hypothetical protein